MAKQAFAILFLLHAAVVSAADPTPAAKAKAYLDELLRTTGTPGVSVAVARNGTIVFSEGAGYADLENLVPATGTTVFNIGSISKAMTAVAILQLVENGKVALDDPIDKYVLSFPKKSKPITLRHILTHTSGIRHYRDGDFPDSPVNENLKPVATLDQAIKVFKDDPLLFEPGQYYFYSSYAVNLLQGVVEKASGISFEDYLRQHVWTPAGMLATSFDVPDRIVPHRARGYEVWKGKTTNFPYGDVSYKYASGGMISSAEDLVRFGVALDHGRLLKSETIKLMDTPMAGLQRFDPKGPQPLDFGQALIWRIFTDESGRQFVNHCGTVKGFNACLVIYPDADVVAAILGNGDPVTPARKAAVAFAQMFLP
jgi:serine beta-lactamase-like protein LACTB, mitochondrial